ncbi:serine hydrolase domain-containing protein [Gemmatimonas sp.]|uniref:serine hydrolase domain-containing protein n=1 Tax=Gemmatimonas sp. TaxID=1962908 RepID=UPI003983AA16
MSLAPCSLHRCAIALAGVVLASTPLRAQSAPNLAVARARTPLRHGFAIDRLARIDSMLDAAVAQEEIGGAVALVLRDDQVVYERAVGWSDRETQRRMTPDAVFRIASQSKALTSTAVLMLLEEGRLTLDTPASRFLPSFVRTTVATRTDSGVAIVPAKRAITIRDLLTHTAGISYGTDASVRARYDAQGLGPAAGWGWYTADKSEPVCTTMDTLGALPFVAQPGEAWVYGYNTDILGCIVERASGMSLDAFLRSRITQPLGMRDTHFFLPVDQRNRLVTVYAKDSSRVRRAPDGARGQGHYIDGPRISFAGGAGLVSTARDYARFLQMLTHRGRWNGQQYLAPHTVALMTSNQVGTLHGTTTGFGLGFETTERYGATGASSVGTFGWGGAYGSNYKVDPAEGLVIVFMINQLPTGTDVVARFQSMLYGALIDARAHR